MRLDIVSKYRNQLYGLAILWVVVFHAYAIDKVDFSFGHSSGPLSWFATLLNNGNVGVDIFLLLSGICLYFSFSKDGDIGRFMKKRLTRIFIPLWIIDGLYWLIRVVVVGGDPEGFVSRVLLFRFWTTGDTTCWYGSLIVLLYFMYPFFYAFIYSEKAKHRFVRCLLLMGLFYFVCITTSHAMPEFYKATEVALTRISVFILGVYLGKLVHDKKYWGNWAAVAACFAAAFLFFVVMHFELIENKMLMRFFFLVGGVSLSYAICYCFDGISRLCKNHASFALRFLGWIGTFSFELYVSHIMVNQIYRLPSTYVPGQGNLIPYFVIIAPLSILIAWAGSKATAKLIEVFSSRGNRMIG